MSKKKNTLQDLDAFLKQQAATLVKPDAFSTAETNLEPTKTDAASDTVQASDASNYLGSQEDPTFRKKLYDFIIHTLEGQKDSLPEDKVLINTALYLKGGSDWKNLIRQYWREH